MALVKLPRRTPSASFFPPFSMVDDLQNRIRRMFDESMEMEPLTQPLTWLPAAEIVETNEELILTAELPGVALKDIDVAIDDGVLTIKGEKLEERKEGDEERKYHLWERSYGAFTRAFTLPPTVDPDAIRAEFANGVLEVHLPKTREAKARGKKIEVLAK